MISVNNVHDCSGGTGKDAQYQPLMDFVFMRELIQFWMCTPSLAFTYLFSLVMIFCFNSIDLHFGVSSVLVVPMLACLFPIFTRKRYGFLFLPTTPVESLLCWFFVGLQYNRRVGPCGVCTLDYICNWSWSMLFLSL